VTVKPRWAEMGLKEQEYAQILTYMGREPNELELGLFAVMWSEHCGYKHSRPVLKTFPTEGPHVLQGPGENAGIVDIGDGWAVAMKIESHNHPSAIEPYQGAATGVGGIIRDVFTMGARPIALLNSLRFGNLTESHQRHLFSGVVSGIGGYGNCIGIPTVGGEIQFADSYAGNPLVNAMCAGLVRHEDIVRGTASGAGNPVMLVGARTGRDGIHGATFASEELGEGSEAKRPAVQVGDPFMEKLLMEACLELIGKEYVVGIQDLGAAGLTSSASETASRGGGGIDIDTAKVPRREKGMTPYEVMLSESQERMLVIVRKGFEAPVQKVFERYGLTAVVIGHVTDDGILRVRDGDMVAAEVPVEALTTLVPSYTPPQVRPAYLDRTSVWSSEDLPLPADWNDALKKLLAAPNIASREWVYRQYDHTILTSTVIHPGSDAALVRIKGTRRAIALTTDCNGRYCYLDPYTGGGLAVAEAARNIAVTGARPLAVTDCLNFGSPENPEIFYQFTQSAEGMSDACRALGTPVISGNVSFYNETEQGAVYPTPVVGMLGVLDDIDQRCTIGWKQPDDLIVQLGTGAEDLGGSEYAVLMVGEALGKPPVLDLIAEKNLIECCLELIHGGIIRSAHDISDGGLAVALSECCFLGAAGATGAIIHMDEKIRADALLFGEAQARIIVSMDPQNLKKLENVAARHGVPAKIIGRVASESLNITVDGQQLIQQKTSALQAVWQEAIPCIMK
jgi:phosphoribosylformylglycinamidine synthase subunit PurL